MWPLALTALATGALIAGCGGRSSGASVTHRGSSASRSDVAHFNASATAKRRTTSSTQPSLLAFAACMRAHGVPNFPDPKSPGQVPSAQANQQEPTGGFSAAPSGGFTANPNSPAYQTASNDCRSLADATPVSQAVANQVTSAQLKFAVCMRANGVPNFPDPTSDGEIGNDGAITGVNPSSPAVQAAETNCSKFRPLPPGLPGGGPPR